MKPDQETGDREIGFIIGRYARRKEHPYPAQVLDLALFGEGRKNDKREGDHQGDKYRDHFLQAPSPFVPASTEAAATAWEKGPSVGRSITPYFTATPRRMMNTPI